METLIQKGKELYAALATGDADALVRLLAPNFRGELTAGLPNGLGRSFNTLEAMMESGWGVVDSLFDMNPRPDVLLDAGSVLVARGYYVGQTRQTGEPFEAAFAHFWGFDGYQFTSVHQVTDSARWHIALKSRLGL